ncbi:hypothetical protein ASD35_01385 [Pelomonas sp. Root1444]|nr:hypothetical protein ASD35_01385 [Pelomonas sp. Root1444]
MPLLRVTTAISKSLTKATSGKWQASRWALKASAGSVFPAIGAIAGQVPRLTRSRGSSNLQFAAHLAEYRQ